MEDKARNALVSPEWLANHLNDDGVKVVEIVGMFIPFNFHGHIPGSVLLDWRTDMWRPYGRDFVTKPEFERLMKQIGVTNESNVIFCSLEKQFSTYAFWLFRYYGHNKMSVLDGGLAKWMSENLPLAKELDAPRPATVEYSASEPDESIRASRDYVMQHLHDDRVSILDVRSPQEYLGEMLSPPGTPQEGAYCKGRIPGAIGVHFEENVKTDKTFKSVNEIKRIYDSKGITPEKEVIVYCRSGHRASFGWFALRYILGFTNVRVYDGSWTEWGNLVSAPIEM